MQDYLMQRRAGKFQSQKEDHEIDLDEIFVSSKKYTVVGILGKSSSKVYLAKDSLDHLVTIKVSMNADDSWLDLTWEYEKYASAFFKEQKLPIVQVLDEGIVNGRYVLIKEYRAGLTYDEVKELNWVLPGSFIKKLLEEDLQNTRTKFLNSNDGLRSWLDRRGVDLLRNHSPNEQVMIKNMIDKGDLGDHNFLFDPQAREWFCIDP